jgi:hypothetical protein
MQDTYKYRVFVDDNFHYMDPDERYELGSFEDCESAIAACKRIVDEFLTESCKPGRTSEELWQQYVGFGEDPWIATDDPNCPRFSAWDFARARSKELGADR